jgi:tripartite-type tricarboxylate transporter receptor subunit TctC
MASTKNIWQLTSLLVMAFTLAGCGTQGNQAPAAGGYPSKPITFIVPYGAGGSADLMARTMEKAAKKHLGQPLIVTNIPGGGATIGWNELAAAKPDGYTIGYVATSALLQPLYNQGRFHYPTALEPLGQVANLAAMAVVRADRPWQTIDDLVKYAKEHPGEIKFGHSGLGTGLHIVGEMFAKEAGVTIAQVPFPGGEPESVAALLGGHIQLAFASASAVKEHLKSGKVRVLAVSGDKRLTDAEFKNVPTFKERGINVDFTFWYGIGAPKSMPEDVKAKLADGIGKILTDPEVQKNLADLGMPVEYLGPKEFREKWLADSALLTKVVKETGIAERIASQKK